MTGPAHLREPVTVAEGSQQPFVARPGLEGALEAALDGPVGVQLVGEAGMGKTRLAEHVLGKRRVLAVRCADLLGVAARDVVAALLQRLDPPPSDLVHLLRGGSAGEGGAADEELLLRASGHRLAAALPPVALFVDDAELMEDDEAALLSAVMTASERVWVFATRRRLEPLALPVVEVPPLTPGEARQLVDVLLPGASPQLRATVLERAGDSPLFLEQCARLLVENGAVRVADEGVLVVALDRVSEIPRSMRRFVDDRLDLLSPDELEVLGVAAVLGPQPELALLQFLVASSGTVVDQLLNRSLLHRGTDVAGQPIVRFSHALVREAAYERVSVPDRVLTHRAAAEWYAVLPVSQVLESQAFHLEAAANLEEPDCDLLRRTVEAMVLYARSIEEERAQVSHQVLVRAQALVDRRPECETDLLQLHLAISSVMHAAGEEGEAGAAARRALALAEERRETRAVGEAHLQLGRVLASADAEESLRHLELAEQAYAEMNDLGGVGRVEVARSFTRQHSEGTTQQLVSLERAYHLALRSADTRLQASCAQQLALHHAITSGRELFSTWAERSRDMSRRDDLGLEPRLQLSEAILASFGLDAPGGGEAARRAVTAGRELGLRDVYVNAHVAAIDLATVAGELSDADRMLADARVVAATRPSAWASLQLDLLETRIRSRSGDADGALSLLERVAAHELAGHRVMRRDLAEFRAWVALERGRFGEARALAAEAVGVDLETGDRCSQLRPRLIELVAALAGGTSVSLGTIADLKSLARDTGLGTIVQLATRWLYVDELTNGWTIDLHALQPCELVECRALDLEIEALSSRRWELLLEAAEVWGEIGTTVWRARALLWHSELTGTPSPGADDLLNVLGAPEDLARLLRGQVSQLRT